MYRTPRRRTKTKEWEIFLKILAGIFGFLVLLIGISGLLEIAKGSAGGLEGLGEDARDFLVYLAVTVFGLILAIAAIAPEALRVFFKAETKV